MNVFSTKTPEEKYYLGFDFVDVLDGATISSASVNVYEIADGARGDEPISSMIDATKQNINGSIVNFWIQAGTADNFYVIECEVIASDQSVYEGQGLIKVSDVIL